MSKRRKNHTAEQKLAMIKEHLVNKVTVSEICEKYEVAPSVFYRWQTELFEHGAHSFDRTRISKQASHKESRQIKDLEQRLAKTQAKLTQKNEVVAELMEDHMKLKKSLGEI